jgi:hypothetical protein
MTHLFHDDGVTPGERRRFADIYRHCARIAESGKTEGGKAVCGGSKVS